jgi:hypothetical protein
VAQHMRGIILTKFLAPHCNGFAPEKCYAFSIKNHLCPYFSIILDEMSSRNCNKKNYINFHTCK